MKKTLMSTAAVLACTAAVCFLSGNNEARCAENSSGECSVSYDGYHGPRGAKKAGAPDKECRGMEKRAFPGGPSNEFARYDFMKGKLGLSEEQLKKIFDIEQKYRAERFSLRGSDNADFKSLREQEQKEIKDVMTPEQQKKMDEFHKNMKDRKVMKGKKPHGQKNSRHPAPKK